MASVARLSPLALAPQAARSARRQCRVAFSAGRRPRASNRILPWRMLWRVKRGEVSARH
jgi:hypothetical protein